MKGQRGEEAARKGGAQVLGWDFKRRERNFEPSLEMNGGPVLGLNRWACAALTLLLEAPGFVQGRAWN